MQLFTLEKKSKGVVREGAAQGVTQPARQVGGVINPLDDPAPCRH